jgi:deazaflavin-dependent oxidoreductase (nitroreductase family)
MVRPDSYDQQVIDEFRARRGVVSGSMRGLSLLLLHHVGAKSGAQRVTPLAYWRIGDSSPVVLASNYGAPRHPTWYYNLLAQPATTAEIGADTFMVHARVARAEERGTLLAAIAAASPSVASVVERTRRQIPVVILDLLGRDE